MTKVQELNIANRVIFTGFVTTEEKFIILSGAYAFIYPSIYEGFGLPVLESITYNIPTVTSNISSLPEVVGQAAILINPNNIDSIYNALKEVLYNEDTRLVLAERCSKQAKNSHGKSLLKWQKMCMINIKLLNENCESFILSMHIKSIYISGRNKRKQ